MRYTLKLIIKLHAVCTYVCVSTSLQGSGTLCEALLMVEAYRGNIVCPNKHTDPLTSFYGTHLLESETYIGGHVECLETGVFRSDLPQNFKLTPSALQVYVMLILTTAFHST
jgi:DNA polymerase epsilon subunit 1